MTLTELFSLPVGTWLVRRNHHSSIDDGSLWLVHFSSPEEVILRRDGDDGCEDVTLDPDSSSRAVDDLTVLEFSGFPPERNGLYLYREFRDLNSARATIESRVLVVDGELLCATHRHHEQPVDILTTGPRAIGEWALIRDPEPSDCLESMVEVDSITGERFIAIPDLG